MAHSRALPVGRGLFYIAIAAVSWGVGGFAAALLYRHSDLGPIAVTFWRYVGGLALLVLVRRPKKLNPKHLVANGLGMAVYQTAYYVAIDLAGIGVATVVTLGSGPVLIAIGARVFLGERRSPITIGIALAGLVLLVAQDPHAGRHPLAGIGVALLSAAGYAAVTLLNRASTDDPYDSALGGFAVGALALLPPAAIEGLTTRPTAATLGLLAFLGAVPTALAYALFFRGLTVVRATTASVVALGEPLAAVALGALILHEPLTPASAAGGLLLLASVVVLTLQERRSRTNATPVNTTAPPSSAQIHQRGEASGAAAGAAATEGLGGVCAGRASITAEALSGPEDTTTVHRPGDSTGPEV
ncbi:DMT family transporter [Dactylosporangium salmoneum]|uniref:EamA family transporter n=1 Tax=Dactylosporangium salmoneum TaxID=53361 RepID=A0ABN3GT89_9ACTN